MRGLSNLKGIIAREFWKCSIETKPMNKTMDIIKVAMTGPSLHALVWPPHSMANVRHTSDASKANKPGKSSCIKISFHVPGAGLICSGICRSNTSRVMIGNPSGKLIQKHHRQLAPLVKAPPMIGPRMVETIKTPVQMPMSRGC